MSTHVTPGLLMQSWHLGYPNKQAVVGSFLEEDMAPYSQGVHELLTSMLLHVSERKTADQLLQLPILHQLPDL